MRILNATVLEEFDREHPDAATALRRWVQITRAAQWRHFADLRQTDRSADQVWIGELVITIFNIRGNAYRLITQIGYAQQIVLIRQFLTHAAYDKQKWKNQL